MSDQIKPILSADPPRSESLICIGGPLDGKKTIVPKFMDRVLIRDSIHKPPHEYIVHALMFSDRTIKVCVIEGMSLSDAVEQLINSYKK